MKLTAQDRKFLLKRPVSKKESTGLKRSTNSLNKSFVASPRDSKFKRYVNREHAQLANPNYYLNIIKQKSSKISPNRDNSIKTFSAIENDIGKIRVFNNIGRYKEINIPGPGKRGREAIQEIKNKRELLENNISNYLKKVIDKNKHSLDINYVSGIDAHGYFQLPNKIQIGSFKNIPHRITTLGHEYGHFIQHRYHSEDYWNSFKEKSRAEENLLMSLPKENKIKIFNQGMTKIYRQSGHEKFARKIERKVLNKFLTDYQWYKKLSPRTRTILGKL
ncbi:MAG: hypothetical protein AABY07_10780 [Nanoarchaeota archaeon]